MLGKSTYQVNKSLFPWILSIQDSLNDCTLLIKQESKVGVSGHIARFTCSAGFSWQQEVDLKA